VASSASSHDGGGQVPAGDAFSEEGDDASPRRGEVDCLGQVGSNPRLLFLGEGTYGKSRWCFSSHSEAAPH
jgi:hypothetical protein